MWTPRVAHSDGTLPFPPNGHHHASRLDNPSPNTGSVIRRTRTGCRTCRYRKVSCYSCNFLCCLFLRISVWLDQILTNDHCRSNATRRSLYVTNAGRGGSPAIGERPIMREQDAQGEPMPQRVMLAGTRRFAHLALLEVFSI
jgi:hypothetical protein